MIKLKKVRLDSLDSIRGFAACVVAFVWHYQHFTPAYQTLFGKILAPVAMYGFLMVELFFVISGFVMAYGYKEKIAGNEIGFGAYFYKRVRHIYPLMIITLIVVLIEELAFQAIVGIQFVYGGFGFRNFVLNLFMVQYGWFGTEFSFNGPAWTISVEIFCYILFFAMVRFGKSSLFYVTSVAVGLVTYFAGWNYPFFNQAMARGLICFFVGCLLYEIYSRRDRINLKLTNALCLAGVGFSVVFAYLYSYGVWNIEQSVVFVAFMIFVAPMIIWVCVNDKAFKKIMEFKGFVALGRCSMSIFLWHFPVQYGIKIIDVYFGLGINYLSVRFFMIYVGIVLLVSFISRKTIEKL